MWKPISSLVKAWWNPQVLERLSWFSLVIPRRILDLMEHVKSEDLAVADVPQQKDPEAGADGLHETLEALWRCLDLSEESREYVSLCFTSNRKNEVPLSLQSLLAAGCQWPGPGPKCWGATVADDPRGADPFRPRAERDANEALATTAHNDDIIWSNRSIWGPVRENWMKRGWQFQMLGTHRPTGDLHVIIFLCRGGPEDLLWSVYFQSDHLVIYGSQDPKPLGFVGRLTCSGLWCKTWGQNFTSSLGTTSHLQPGKFCLAMFVHQRIPQLWPMPTVRHFNARKVVQTLQSERPWLWGCRVWCEATCTWHEQIQTLIYRCVGK